MRKVVSLSWPREDFAKQFFPSCPSKLEIVVESPKKDANREFIGMVFLEEIRVIIFLD